MEGVDVNQAKHGRKNIPRKSMNKCPPEERSMVSGRDCN